MKSSSCVLAAALCVISATEAFVVSPSAAARCRSSRRRDTQQVAAAEPDVEKPEGASMDNAWDGKSRPKRSVRSDSIPLDTRNWEVAGQRTDVWEDQPNPLAELEWFKNFAPSDEEVAAAEAGYDWTDEWFEADGVTAEEDTSSSDDE